MRHVLGAADVGVLLGAGEVVPADIPPADANLEVLVFLRVRLRVAQFIHAEDGELDYAPAVPVEHLHEGLHDFKPLVARAYGRMEHHVERVVAGENRDIGGGEGHKEGEYDASMQLFEDLGQTGLQGVAAQAAGHDGAFGGTCGIDSGVPAVLYIDTDRR